MLRVSNSLTSSEAFSNSSLGTLWLAFELQDSVVGNEVGTIDFDNKKEPLILIRILQHPLKEIKNSGKTGRSWKYITSINKMHNVTYELPNLDGRFLSFWGVTKNVRPILCQVSSCWGFPRLVRGNGIEETMFEWFKAWEDQYRWPLFLWTFDE